MKQACRSRLRSARHVAQTLHRQLRRKGEQKEEEQRALYQKLIQTTKQMMKQADLVASSLIQQTEKKAQRLLASVQPLVPLIERVIVQARSRVLEGKKVPSTEKVLSLYEPHTRAIPRHKGGALVEFGRHVVVDEVEGGIITRFEVCEQPHEHGQADEALAHHQHLFEHPPRWLAGDRGMHAAGTRERAEAAGVKTVAIPAVGKLSEEQRTHERSRAFKRAYRWRAGIEGRIHSLRRDYGLRRCGYHGQDGMQRWIGLGIIASNLRRIARVTAA
jgi:IS5 family transposase